MGRIDSYDNILGAAVAANDELTIWDTSTAHLKNITAAELANLPQFTGKFAPLASPSFTGPLAVDATGLREKPGSPYTLQWQSGAAAWSDIGAGGGGGTPADTVADLDGTGAAGASTDYSRGDHKHADANRHAHANQADLDLVSGTNTGDGAPADAHYLTTRAETGLSAEANLGALASGLLKHTVADGVSTPATALAGTDYLAPDGDGSALTGLIQSQISNLASDLADKAPLASPHFTGSATIDESLLFTPVPLGNSGAAKTIDFNDGPIQTMTLTGEPDCAITLTPPADGKNGRLSLILDQGAGAKTISFVSAVNWPGGIAPTLSVAAGAIDIISFLCVAGVFYVKAGLDFK